MSTFKGLYTQQAKTAPDDTYASDMLNLRIDGEGWLQPRADVKTVQRLPSDITGIAATATHVFLLTSGGQLYVKTLAALDSETPPTEITGVSNLQGRLSVVRYLPRLCYPYQRR